MAARGHVPSGYGARPVQALGMMRHGPFPAGHHPMETTLPPNLENKLVVQEAEIERLAGDNQRLAASDGALRQDLGAAEQDIQRLRAHLRSIQTESDIQIRVLVDKIAKMEAEIRGGEIVKKELHQAHIEAQSLVADRKELTTKIEVATKELEKTRADMKKLPEMIDELDSLRKEHQRLRCVFVVNGVSGEQYSWFGGQPVVFLGRNSGLTLVFGDLQLDFITLSLKDLFHHSLLMGVLPFVDSYKGKQIQARAGKVAMAATIYLIWQERDENISVKDEETKFEYEKGLNMEKFEEMQAMDQDLMAMSREIERLRSEVLNTEKRAHVPNRYGGGPYMNLDPLYPPPMHSGAGYVDNYGRTHAPVSPGPSGEGMVPYGSVGAKEAPGGAGSAPGGGYAWGGAYDTSHPRR
ncbi:hypothetical protein LguiB_010565 [Lonicera macranthoides]